MAFYSICLSQFQCSLFIFWSSLQQSHGGVFPWTSFVICFVCFSPTVSGFLMLHHFGLDARLLLISNSTYSGSFWSHSSMLTKRGCDSICVGCKTGMIVELGICVSNDAIIEDFTSPSSYLKMTQHIIVAKLTHATLSTERMGAMKDEIMIESLF